MTNWKKYNLKEVTSKIGSGSTPRGGDSAYKTHGISLIRSQNVLDFTFSKNGLAFIDDDQAHELRNVTLEQNDVLVNITGDSVARVCQVPNEILPARVNQHVAILRADTNQLSPSFLKYSLLTPSAKSNLLSLSSSGATRKALTKVMLEDFEIQAPELKEQHAIAEILSALDEKIELNLQTNKTLEEMANALYNHWFVNFGPFKDVEFVESELGMIPEGWEVVTMNSMVEFINGYAFKSSELLDEPEGDCYSVFKMGNIKKGGGLKPDGTKSYFKKENSKGLEKYILKRGDLLMSMTDMKDKVTILGHTALMNEDDLFIVNQRVGLLRLNNTMQVGYSFLYILTNNREFIYELRSKANSGVQVNLSTDSIKNSKFVIGPTAINKSFNDVVSPLFEKIFSHSAENETLKSLRDYLLPKLISGEIRVKEAVKVVKEIV